MLYGKPLCIHRYDDSAFALFVMHKKFDIAEWLLNKEIEIKSPVFLSDFKNKINRCDNFFIKYAASYS